LKDKTIVPLPRSGHSLTSCRTSYVLFGGTVNGLKDPNFKKIGPTNEVWNLDILPKSNFNWTKIQVKGQIPEPRSNHIAVTVKKPGGAVSTEILFIHGGMGEKGKFDDAFFYDPFEQKFLKIDFRREKDDQGRDSFPSPRANHAACLYDYKVYIYGGNGGKIYENSVFKDLWEFDCEKLTFREIKYENQTSK